MSLFRLDASLRVDGSHSREIADIVETEWTAAHPGEAVLRRHVGTEPIPAEVWAQAVTAGWVAADQRTEAQRDAQALAAREVDPLFEADAYLFAVPLYNFGVSQHFKAWVDLAITDPRLAPGQPPQIAGRPAVLVTVRGGNYQPGTPREDWDHSTAWIRRILADVWQLDLKVVEADFTLVGVNPALDQFKELAVQLRTSAEQQARAHGQHLTGTVAA